MVGQLYWEWVLDEGANMNLYSYIPNVSTVVAPKDKLDEEEIKVLKEACWDESLVPHIYDKRALHNVTARWYRAMESHSLVKEFYLRGHSAPKFDVYDIVVSEFDDKFEIRYEYAPLPALMCPRGWLAKVNPHADEFPVSGTKAIRVICNDDLIDTSPYGAAMHFGAFRMEGYMKNKASRSKDNELWVRML